MGELHSRYEDVEVVKDEKMFKGGEETGSQGEGDGSAVEPHDGDGYAAECLDGDVDSVEHQDDGDEDT